MKEFDFNMSTAYLPYKKRALIPNSMLIPIGTKVFTVYLGSIEEVQVNKYNQKMITMYYNTLYFLKEEDAEKVKNNIQLINMSWIDNFKGVRLCK